MGLEVSGTIVAQGAKATRFHINDSVCALVNGGGYAEYVVAPESQCLPVPKNMDLVSASCLPETFFTVWHNLFQQSNIYQEKLQKGTIYRIEFILFNFLTI